MKTRERNAWSDAVARQIKVERAAAGLTQKDLYEAAGMASAVYKRLEGGSRVASSDQLAAVLAVLHVPMSKFYERVEERIISEMRLSPEESADLWGAITHRSPPASEAPPTTNNDQGVAEG